MVNRSECDPDEQRVFALNPEDATCEACQQNRRRRDLEWHRELAASRGQPSPDFEDDTAPGKRQR